MRKLIAGAALLALLMNSPAVSADEDVVVFGEEFGDEKPAPKPVEKPAPVREIPKPVEKPKPEPVNEPVEKPQPAEVSDDDDLGDVLVFDDISRQKPTPKPVEKPKPESVNEPVEKPKPEIVNEPFKEPKPEPISEPKPVDEPVIEPKPAEQPKTRRTRSSRRQTASPQNLKVLPQRFIKLAVDETYIYYLDKKTIQWKKMPYSTSEYMADFWVRMIERDPQNSDDDFYGENASSLEILTAREQGYRYTPEDEEILRRQSYVLEHYYLRPKTKQIQFLCELEVFGRPQNTINERVYDYRNWEDLVPGSVESAIYASVVQVLDLTKDNPKGHMTFWDMLDEYARVSL